MTTNLPMIRASNSLAPIAASTVPPAIRDSLGDILVAFSAGGRDDDRPRLLKLYAKALSGFEEIVAARALDHLLTHNPRNPFQPTPQDLHEACVRIRDEWSSAVRQHYILGGDRVGVSIPAPIVAGLMREWTSDPGMQSKLVTIDAERYDRLPPEFFEPGRKAEIDALRVARKEAEDEARKRKAELERAEDVRRAEKAKRDAEDRAREAEKEARWLLKQPYLAKEAITLTNASATSSASPLSADNNVKLLRVEVQQGKRVQYEVNPPGLDARTATSSSPILYGEEMISFGPGWLISLIEAS